MVFKNPRNSSLLSGPHSVATQMYGKPKRKYIKICKTLNASSTWDVVKKIIPILCKCTTPLPVVVGLPVIFF